MAGLSPTRHNHFQKLNLNWDVGSDNEQAMYQSRRPLQSHLIPDFYILFLTIEYI